MVTPVGEVWSVSSNVTDAAGQPVAGVTPAGGGESGRLCGVVISEASQQHIGDWRCRKEETVTTELVVNTQEILTDLRLPGTFLPTHYDVRLVPDLDYEGEQVVFEGEVTMSVRAVEDTNTFTFHSDEITPLGVPQLRENSTDLPVHTVSFDLQRMFVTLSSPVLRRGQEYQVSVLFSANITRQGRTNYGFHPAACSEAEAGLGGRRCWFTQFESTFARFSFFLLWIYFVFTSSSHQDRLPLPGRARPEGDLRCPGGPEGGLPGQVQHASPQDGLPTGAARLRGGHLRSLRPHVSLPDGRGRH